MKRKKKSGGGGGNGGKDIDQTKKLYYSIGFLRGKKQEGRKE